MPKSRKRRAKRRSATAPVKRRATPKQLAALRKARAARRASRETTAVVSSTVRRKGRKARRKSTTVHVSKRKRRGAKKVRLTRRSGGRTKHPVVYVSEATRSSRRRKKRRHSRAAYAPKRRYHMKRRRSSRDNPLGGFGEYATAAVAAGAGYFLASLAERWFAKRNATDAAGNVDPVSMQLQLQGAPDMKSWLVNAASAAVLLAAGGMVPPRHRMLKTGLQGAGLGAGAHLVSKFLTSVVAGKWLRDNKYVAPLYNDVISAELAQESAVGTGTAGFPGVGAATGNLMAVAPPISFNYVPGLTPASDAPRGRTLTTTVATPASPPGQVQVSSPIPSVGVISAVQPVPVNPTVQPCAPSYVPVPVAVQAGPTNPPMMGMLRNTAAYEQRRAQAYETAGGAIDDCNDCTDGARFNSLNFFQD